MQSLYTIDWREKTLVVPNRWLEGERGMLGGVGPTELVIILFIILVIFGAGKLPEIGGALGKGIKNFKKATREPDEIDITPSSKEIEEESTPSKEKSKAE
jgi:sec-independent protein translocase protein TatA